MLSGNRLLHQSHLVRHGSCAGCCDVHVGRQDWEVDFGIPRQRSISRLEAHRSGDLDPGEDLVVDESVDGVRGVVRLGYNREDHHSVDRARVVGVIFGEIQAADHG